MESAEPEVYSDGETDNEQSEEKKETEEKEKEEEESEDKDGKSEDTGGEEEEKPTTNGIKEEVDEENKKEKLELDENKETNSVSDVEMKDSEDNSPVVKNETVNSKESNEDISLKSKEQISTTNCNETENKDEISETKSEVKVEADVDIKQEDIQEIKIEKKNGKEKVEAKSEPCETAMVDGDEPDDDDEEEDMEEPLALPNGDKFNALSHLYPGMRWGSPGIYNGTREMNGSYSSKLDTSSGLSNFSFGPLNTSGMASPSSFNVSGSLMDKQWFSLLPRDACDDSSITRAPVRGSGSGVPLARGAADIRIPWFPRPQPNSAGSPLPAASPAPSSRPSLCDSPPPLTAEEAAMHIDQLRRLGETVESEPRPVPRGKLSLTETKSKHDINVKYLLQSYVEAGGESQILSNSKLL